MKPTGADAETFRTGNAQGKLLDTDGIQIGGIDSQSNPHPLKASRTSVKENVAKAPVRFSTRVLAHQLALSEAQASHASIESSLAQLEPPTFSVLENTTAAMERQDKKRAKKKVGT